MAQGESQINPWVRANLEQYNEETEALIPTFMQERYRFVMAEIIDSSQVLGEAQERYAAARLNQAEFFKVFYE